MVETNGRPGEERLLLKGAITLFVFPGVLMMGTLAASMLLTPVAWAIGPGSAGGEFFGVFSNIFTYGSGACLALWFCSSVWPRRITEVDASRA